jgi:hypothetical protein
VVVKVARFKEALMGRSVRNQGDRGVRVRAERAAVADAERKSRER